MFWPFKRKKKPVRPIDMINNLYHTDIESILDKHPYYSKTFGKDFSNYANNLNYLFHLYAAELIRLNKEINTLKKIMDVMNNGL